MRQYACLLLLLSAMQFPILADAANLKFLSSTSIGNLTQEERSDLTDFVVDTLNKAKSFDKDQWESKKGSSALIKILAEYEHQSIQCKRIKLAIRASQQRRYQTVLWNICNTDNGWKKVEPPLAMLSDTERETLKSDLFHTLDNGENGHPANFNYANADLKVVAVPYDDADSTKNSKAECRTLSVTVFDNDGVMLSGSYLFCLNKDGWQHTATDR